MGMLVGRRWIYSKVGNAWEYYISKRSKYKEVVERAVESCSDYDCVKSKINDRYCDRKYLVITVKFDFNCPEFIDTIDKIVIDALKGTDCKSYWCKVKIMKGDGEPCRKRK